jgi:holo-[acyl-carrier protein] synthase
MPADLEVRVGIDMAAVDDVRDSIERFGDRYLNHVFTPHELSCCGDEPVTRATALAARFAAKEATIKVLRPTDARPPWTSIEVHRESGGWCELRLSDAAARMADEQHMTDFAVSLTHEAGFAAAVVVGYCNGDADHG